MPTYVYRCEAGHETEVIHSMLEAPRLFCSACGKQMYKRPVISNVLWSRFIEPSPAVRDHLATIDQQREDYLEHHHD